MIDWKHVSFSVIDLDTTERGFRNAMEVRAGIKLTVTRQVSKDETMLTRGELRRAVVDSMLDDIHHKFYGDIRHRLSELEAFVRMHCEHASFEQMNEKFKPLWELLKRPTMDDIPENQRPLLSIYHCDPCPSVNT